MKRIVPRLNKFSSYERCNIRQRLRGLFRGINRHKANEVVLDARGGVRMGFKLKYSLRSLIVLRVLGVLGKRRE